MNVEKGLEGLFEKESCESSHENINEQTHTRTHTHIYFLYSSDSLKPGRDIFLGRNGRCARWILSGPRHLSPEGEDFPPPARLLLSIFEVESRLASRKDARSPSRRKSSDECIVRARVKPSPPIRSRPRSSEYANPWASSSLLKPVGREQLCALSISPTIRGQKIEKVPSASAVRFYCHLALLTIMPFLYIFSTLPKSSAVSRCNFHPFLLLRFVRVLKLLWNTSYPLLYFPILKKKNVHIFCLVTSKKKDVSCRI